MYSIPSKKIYIIRHGQTQANVDKVFQSVDDPLTPLGLEQIQHLARRSVELAPDVILSSTMLRAYMTAEAIQAATGAPLVKDDALREYMVPSALFNKPIASEEGKDFHRALRENITDPNWRYADEDNFMDLHERALSVLSSIEARDEKRIFLVSHGAFISILLNAMMCEGKTSPTTASRMFRFLRTENTGLSVIDYHEDATIANKWRLRVWNDYSHLPKELRTLV